MPAFVDTNILLYAHDAGAGEKRVAAAALLRRLVESDAGVVSTQVLMEFYVNATRKLAQPLDEAGAARVVNTYAAWVASPTGADTVRRALQLRERFRFSPWDALIVAAAIEARCEILYSEDLQNGQRVDGVEIRNPFLAVP
ncbi:MAG: PIN domain-containing protein [Betaproteobacteria bacterium]|nr:PIN domain-containing protein [Betaproteobacteria bacterium]